MEAKGAIEIGKATVREFNQDKVLRLSAAMAYYAIFSIGPLLFLLIFLAGLIFGENSVREQIQTQIQQFVGPQAAKTVESMMSAPKTEGHGLVTTIIGIVTLIFGATGVFGQLQDALNTIWEVQPKPGQGIWSFIRSRFLSLSMVLGLGFLLLISMVITTAVQALASGFGGMVSAPKVIMAILSGVLSFVVVAFFFLLVFKLLPDVKVRWRPLWIGALISAALFTAGKYLLGLYLGRESTSSSYGAAGSVVVLLLWIYYATLILFVGAELTHVLAAKTGAIIAPEEYAEPVTEEAREEQGIPHHHHRPQEG